MALRPTRLLALVAIGTLALSACGSSGKSSSGANPTTPSTATPSTTPVSAASSSPAAFTASLQPTKLGTTLVDSKGMTLYAFKVDTKGKSNCNTNQGCQSVWPPLRPSASIKLGPGLDAEDFVVITRQDGTKQLTDYGAPLYTFSGDSKAGDTNGDGFMGKWYAVGKEGAAANSALTSSATSTPSTTPPTTAAAAPGY
jgi:predicted lipoprotein with Yx(FWY)xxD motif